MCISKCFEIETITGFIALFNQLLESKEVSVQLDVIIVIFRKFNIIWLTVFELYTYNCI